MPPGALVSQISFDCALLGASYRIGLLHFDLGRMEYFESTDSGLSWSPGVTYSLSNDAIIGPFGGGFRPRNLVPGTCCPRNLLMQSEVWKSPQGRMLAINRARHERRLHGIVGRYYLAMGASAPLWYRLTDQLHMPTQ